MNLTDAACDAFFKRLHQYTAQKCGGAAPEWEHIPQAERTRLMESYAAWFTPYAKTINLHTKVETLAKNEAKAAAKAVIRLFVNRFLRKGWDAVTNEDRLYLEIPIADTIPTSHPVPVAKPALEAEPAGRGKHRITALDPQTETKKKPALVKGVAFACKARRSDEPAARAEEMPSVFQVRTAREFQWTEADYGKVVDYAAAYENEGGKRGPWSDVASLIIT